MTCRQRDSTEMFCLQQLANLDELEGPWVELMAIGDPPVQRWHCACSGCI